MITAECLQGDTLMSACITDAECYNMIQLAVSLIVRFAAVQQPSHELPTYARATQSRYAECPFMNKLAVCDTSVVIGEFF